VAAARRARGGWARAAVVAAGVQLCVLGAVRETFVLLSLGQDVPDSVRQRAQAAIQAIDSGTASAIPAIVAAASAAPTPAAPVPAAGESPVPDPAPAG
ncbi:MAG: hypothetical protein ACK58O_00230, partial [Brevundimonas sp.]